jgi:FkbM family methyltransferase
MRLNLIARRPDKTEDQAEQTRNPGMSVYNSKRYLFLQRLKLVVEYCIVFSIPRSAWVVAWILAAKLLRRPYIRLPVPNTRRTIRLRTNSSDIETYNQVLIQQDYDFSQFPYAPQFGSGPPTVEAETQRITIVDCGANVGCSVMWFATRFPDAEIVAIEPDSANFELLNQNVAGLHNVRTVRAALWCSETRVVISNPDAEPWLFRTEAVTGNTGQNSPLIDTVTMDSLLADTPSSTRIVVKMDIEGAEREVFSKNTSWLRCVDVLIIELHDWMFPGQDCGRIFFSALASRPIDYVGRGENLFCFQRKDKG